MARAGPASRHDATVDPQMMPARDPYSDAVDFISG
jgi:hypothetical protein